MLTVWLLCQWGSWDGVTVPFPSAQQERKLIRITKRFWIFLQAPNIFTLRSGNEGKVEKLYSLML